MISVYQLKSRFQRLLRPILSLMRRIGITPNQITLSAIVFSLFLGICLWNAEQFRAALWIVPFGLFIRMALNALDGMMAQTYQLKSRQGEVLNELGDVISDMVIFIPLIKLQGVNTLIATLFICLAIINEFAGLLGKVVSGIRRYDGPMGKSDRVFVIGLLLLLGFFFPVILSFANYVLLSCIVLMIVSTYTRISGALKNKE